MRLDLQVPPSATDSSVARSIGPLRDSFLRHLAAENRSASTRATCGAAVDLLAAFSEESGELVGLDRIRREHIEAFLIALRARGQRPATLANRYRSLQQFVRLTTPAGRQRSELRR
jgi:site-specific recombinase XerC